MLTIGGLATVAASTPLGGLVDRVIWKRAVVGVAAGAVGLAAMTEALLPFTWPVGIAQLGRRALDRDRLCHRQHRGTWPRSIDHGGARGADDRQQRQESGLRIIFTSRPLLMFTAAITLFHFANAAMLPVAGERLAPGASPGTGSLPMAGCMWWHNW